MRNKDMMADRDIIRRLGFDSEKQYSNEHFLIEFFKLILIKSWSIISLISLNSYHTYVSLNYLARLQTKGSTLPNVLSIMQLCMK